MLGGVRAVDVEIAGLRRAYNRLMSRIEKLRKMTPAEVVRIQRVHAEYGTDEEKVIEAIADLRAYCGEAWPKMLETAVRRYRADHRGDHCQPQ